MRGCLPMGEMIGNELLVYLRRTRVLAACEPLYNDRRVYTLRLDVFNRCGPLMWGPY